MKAYNICPICNTRNEPIWTMNKPNRPYYICLCTECQNMYYQLSDIKVHIKSIDILLNQINPVPYITNTKSNNVNNATDSTEDCQSVFK